MRGEDGHQGIVGEGALEGDEADALQHDFPRGVGEDLLFDAVPLLTAGVRQAERGYALGKGDDGVVGVTLLFGQPALAIGDDESQVADAGLVDAGVVDLVENAVAKREPDPATGTERGAHAAFRTGSPAGLDARPARCEGWSCHVVALA